MRENAFNAWLDSLRWFYTLHFGEKCHVFLTFFLVFLSVFFVVVVVANTVKYKTYTKHFGVIFFQNTAWYDVFSGFF